MNTELLRADCPAKINLALRILGRREDGYHELQTLYQAIDLWDRLDLRPSRGLSLTCNDPRLPTDGSNLVLRAAELLCRRHGRPGCGAEFRLEKAIPVQGGLGGGSSNAAGALMLCARSWELELKHEELLELATELGSDVPFFLRGGRALGSGRGERLAPWPPGELHLLLGFPPFGIATREVYHRLASRLTPHRNDVSVPLLSAHKWPQENDFGFMANDLEAVVFDGWPELESFRDALRTAGARKALLSGSGSAVYGIFDGPDEVERALDGLRRCFARWQLCPSRTIDGGIRLHVVGAASEDHRAPGA